MRNRHTEIFKDGELIDTEVLHSTVSEHITLKLAHIGAMIAGESKALDLNKEDMWKYDNNRSVLTKEKIARFDVLKVLQRKHADIKKLVKSRTTHEELDDIAWGTFKKKFSWFFNV